MRCHPLGSGTLLPSPLFFQTATRDLARRHAHDSIDTTEDNNYDEQHDQEFDSMASTKHWSLLGPTSLGEWG